MNLNYTAKIISSKEKSHGKKRNTKELPIGQIKEVMRLLLIELAKTDEKDALRTIRRYK